MVSLALEDAASPDDVASMTPPNGAFIVARLDGRPIGCGAFKMQPHARAYLWRMWISREDRGLGLGRRMLAELERPDVIFTHWPVETRPDHRAVSLLVYDARMRMGMTAALAYFEVLNGEQTEVFHPTNYVDISAVAQRKRDACFAHASQKPEEWYPVHERMGQFRGMEHGCASAEAFIRHDRGPAIPFPG